MADKTKGKHQTSGVAYKAAASASQFPKAGKAEIAFAGRSNVGKSTLVNALSQRKNLARTSKTPGKTRLVFFYDVAPDHYYVDLPGYGYAKTSQDERQAFSKVTNEYFESQRPTALVLLLLDIRRGFGDLDLQMLDYLCHFDIDLQVVLTKSDKLSRQAILKAEAQAMEVIQSYADQYGRLARRPLSLSAGFKPRDQAILTLKAMIADHVAGSN